MSTFRPDVVFDCNIFLQAISRSHGPAARALQLVDQNLVNLHVSRPILAELRRVLAYPEADADLPVTRDRDLLCLMTSHEEKAKQFRQRAPRLSVVEPVEFITRIVREPS